METSDAAAHALQPYQIEQQGQLQAVRQPGQLWARIEQGPISACQRCAAPAPAPRTPAQPEQQARCCCALLRPC